jgi:hypothetical protein
LKKVISRRKSEYAAGKDPVDEIVPVKGNGAVGRKVAPPIRISKGTGAHARILVAVVSSRRTFDTRVAEILRTWGDETDKPKNISLRYFVGALKSSESYESGSDEDVSQLATTAGIRDSSSIVVLKEVVDSDPFSAEKAAAVIKRSSKIVRSSKRDAQGRFDWILHVHDDTYVNLDYLQDFVEPVTSAGFAYLGSRANRRQTDRESTQFESSDKPYCIGGPGILFSRSTLTSLARNIDGCLEKSKNTKTILADDVFIGMCVQRETGHGCWDDENYDESAFMVNPLGIENFVPDSSLLTTVSIHPVKEASNMTSLHERIRRLRNSFEERTNEQ